MSDERSYLSIITGSFSSPAVGNPTVVVVEAAYRRLGVDARYLNCDVLPEHLGDAVRGALAMGWAGFNLSIPHKVAVLQHLDRLAASAEIIGAVNCVTVTRDGELVGENTDGQGFVASLRALADLPGKAIVLLGAGGAARAIAVETALAGAASVTVVNRDRRRGQELADLIDERTPAAAKLVVWDRSYEIPAGTDILVNATSVGLFPDTEARLNINTDNMLPGTVVADVIPNPPHTALLESARQRGCATLDGLGMLVNQAAINIRHWTGLEADTDLMQRTLVQLFQAGR
jgi:shikimate dehydrogenase